MTKTCEEVLELMEKFASNYYQMAYDRTGRNPMQ